MIDIRLKKLLYPALIILLLAISADKPFCQPAARYLTLRTAQQQAKAANTAIRNAHLQTDIARQGRWSVVQPGPLEVQYRYGQLYSAQYGQYTELSQSLGSPLAPIARARVVHSETALAVTNTKLVAADVTLAVQHLWWDWQCLLLTRAMEQAYFVALDSAINLLGQLPPDSSPATSRLRNYRLKALESQAKLFDFDTREMHIIHGLQELLNTTDTLVCADTDLSLYQIAKPLDTLADENPLVIGQKQAMVTVAKQQWQSKRYEAFPQFRLGAFVQSVGSGRGYSGVMAGISIPIPTAVSAASTQARLQTEIVRNNLQSAQMHYTHEVEYLRQSLESQFAQLEYLRTRTDMLTGNLLPEGEPESLSPLELIQILPLTSPARAELYQAIVNYNRTAARLEYLLAK